MSKTVIAIAFIAFSVSMIFSLALSNKSDMKTCQQKFSEATCIYQLR